KSEVYREYEVLVERRDSQGKLTRNWERKNEKVGGTEKSVEFILKDESGEIPISIEGANKISQKVVDKFEPAASAGGGLSFSFGNFTFSNSSSNRTIGYKKVEYCIPNNSSLYILGEVNDRDGKMKISKPIDKKNQFIVSTKSEEELVSQFEKSAKIMLIFSYIFVVLGGISILYGIYQSIK
ncbi:MAG: E3 ubiquitin ligase family protein, partial [Ignavibacteriales bacterium]|nr:E3 ubiquitin ligase family protein [Ignavibacteriales bacterium]